MKKVSQEEFFREIGRFNCHPKLSGPYPYLSSFETPGRQVIGEKRPIEKFTPKGNPVYPPEFEYFIHGK